MKKKMKYEAHFNDKLVFALFFAGIIGGVYGLAWALLQNMTLDVHLAYLAVVLVLLGLLLSVRRFRTKLKIDRKKIKIKANFITRKKVTIPWEDVTHCEVVSSQPWAVWMSGNVHFSHIHWLSVDGPNGLYIETKHGDRYLLGCKDIDHLEQYAGRFAPKQAFSAAA